MAGCYEFGIENSIPDEMRWTRIEILFTHHGISSWKQMQSVNMLKRWPPLIAFSSPNDKRLISDCSTPCNCCWTPLIATIDSALFTSWAAAINANSLIRVSRAAAHSACRTGAFYSWKFFSKHSPNWAVKFFQLTRVCYICMNGQSWSVEDLNAWQICKLELWRRVQDIVVVMKWKESHVHHVYVIFWEHISQSNKSLKHRSRAFRFLKEKQLKMEFASNKDKTFWGATLWEVPLQAVSPPYNGNKLHVRECLGVIAAADETSRGT